MSARAITVGWLVIVCALLLLEGYTLGRPAFGDSLSEHVHAVRNTYLGRLILYPLWVWLTYHWFIAPVPRLSWLDAFAVGLGILVVLSLSLAKL